MGKTLTGKAVSVKTTDWKAVVSQGIAEIGRANERMEQRQAEIEKIKAETRAILDELKAN